MDNPAPGTPPVTRPCIVNFEPEATLKAVGRESTTEASTTCRPPLAATPRASDSAIVPPPFKFTPPAPPKVNPARSSWVPGSVTDSAVEPEFNTAVSPPAMLRAPSMPGRPPVALQLLQLLQLLHRFPSNPPCQTPWPLYTCPRTWIVWEGRLRSARPTGDLDTRPRFTVCVTTRATEVSSAPAYATASCEALPAARLKVAPPPTTDSEPAAMGVTCNASE